MPRLQTRQFGELDYAEESTLNFPRGLPGFEDRHRFVLLDDARHAPLVHLQSLDSGELCFLALPVRSIDPQYETELSSEDRDVIGDGHTLELALLSAGQDGSVSANLLAPVVIELATRRAVQAVRFDTRYSHQHPLVEEPVCS